MVVAVNFDGKPAAVSYRGLTRAGAYRDWFGKTPVTLGDSGRIEIPANGYRVCTFDRGRAGRAENDRSG